MMLRQAQHERTIELIDPTPLILSLSKDAAQRSNWMKL